MRRIFLVLLTVLLAACSAAAPAVPTSTPAPTAEQPQPTPAQATATPALPPTPTATLPPPTPTAVPPTPTSTPDAAAQRMAAELRGAAWGWSEAGVYQYALAFLPEGKLAVQADCAALQGTYQINGGALKIESADPGQPACPTGSRQAEFVSKIRSASAFAIEGGVLTLTTSDGALRFAGFAMLTPPAPAEGAAVIQTTGFAALRAGPGDGYPAYGVLVPGQSVGAAGRNYDSGWWAVTMPGFPDGMAWVAPGQVSVSSPDKAPWIRTAGLHIDGGLLWPDNKDPRASLILPSFILSGPGTNYPITLVGLPGDTFYVLGRSADGLYLAVYVGPGRTPGGLGWVLSAEADPHNTDNLPVYPAPPVPATARYYQPSPDEPVAAALTIINIRSGPGREYTSLGMLERGEYARITARSLDNLWYQIAVSPSVSADGYGWVAQSVVRAINPEKVTKIINAFPHSYRRPDTVNPACTVVSQLPRELTRFDQGVDFTLQFEIRNDTDYAWGADEVDFVYIENIDNAMFHTGPNRVDLEATVQPGQTYILKMDARTPIKHAGVFGERWVVRRAGGTVCTFTFQVRLNP